MSQLFHVRRFADIWGHCRVTLDSSTKLLFSWRPRDTAIINWLIVNRVAQARVHTYLGLFHGAISPLSTLRRTRVIAIISLRGRLNDRFSFLAKLSPPVVYDRNQVAGRPDGIFRRGLKCRAKYVFVRASGPTKKQNIWTDAEKSKLNEQKQQEKLELNERLPAEFAKTFPVKTTIV